MWLQVPGAHGRYILCQSRGYSVKDVTEILSKRFPQDKFSSTKDGSAIPGFDTSKVCTCISYVRIHCHDQSPCAHAASRRFQELVMSGNEQVIWLCCGGCSPDLPLDPMPCLASGGCQ